MEARPTQELNIGSHTFVTKTYATAREHQAIQQALFAGAKLEVVGEQPKIHDFNPTILFDMHQAVVRELVVTMDGTSEEILGRCLDLPSGDFDELVAALDKLVSKKKN